MLPPSGSPFFRDNPSSTRRQRFGAIFLRVDLLRHYRAGVDRPDAESLVPAAGENAMLRQLMVGTVASACNITIHALIMVALLQIARATGTIQASRPSSRLIVVMIAAVSVLMASHASEVMVWSLVFAIIGAAPPGTDLINYAFVTYTTLGGNVVPEEHWRLLAPLTAMNGVLLFGWSTAVIFEIMRRELYRDF